MFVLVKDTNKVKDLFAGWQETLIWSCLQNIIGQIYVEEVERPTSAMALVGDFCFFAGCPNERLVSFKPQECGKDFMIMVPQNQQWAQIIEKIYEGRGKKVTRYAIKKEMGVFDKGKLQRVVDSLDSIYLLEKIDQEIFEACRANEWSRDLVSQYKDFDEYEKLGVGYAIFKGEILVSGASSYTRYLEGIEVEIDTKEEFRRKGLAYVCGAKLILECLEKGLYPSWDAQNMWSVALAEKLGYHYDHEYTAYEIWGF